AGRCRRRGTAQQLRTRPCRTRPPPGRPGQTAAPARRSGGPRVRFPGTTFEVNRLMSGSRRAGTGAAGARTPHRYAKGMCRNIRTLYNFDPPATDEEIRAAAVQFVRKLSGFTRPSKANEAAFDNAVEEVAAVARRLIDSLVTAAAPRDRE